MVIILKGRGLRNYMPAPCSGIFASLVYPADHFHEGQRVACIHSLEHPGCRADQVRAEMDGIAASVGAISWREQDDSTFAVGPLFAGDAPL